jgi:hypothetical protein
MMRDRGSHKIYEKGGDLTLTITDDNNTSEYYLQLGKIL